MKAEERLGTSSDNEGQDIFCFDVENKRLFLLSPEFLSDINMSKS